MAMVCPRYKGNRIKERPNPFKDGDFSALCDRLAVWVSFVLAIALLLCAGGMVVKFRSFKTYRDLTNASKQTFYSAYGYEEGVKALKAENSDIKAWLLLEGTSIDSPVCQTDNDSFYLNHDYLKQENAFGTLFFAQDDLVSITMPDQNLVVYGKSIGDSTPFSCLNQFLDINFYKQHHIIHLYTKDYDVPYVVFAVLILPSSSDKEGFIDITRSSFSNERQFHDWMKKINEQNIISTELNVRSHNKFLTLVTDYDKSKDTRLVVIARELEKFEGSNLDTGIVAINKDVKKH